MGIEYYVVDIKRNEGFNLGKGGWVYLEEEMAPRAIKSWAEKGKHAFAKYILECWNKGHPEKGLETYALGVGSKLYDWCVVHDWNVVLMNDHANDEVFALKVTGTRYEDE